MTAARLTATRLIAARLIAASFGYCQVANIQVDPCQLPTSWIAATPQLVVNAAEPVLPDCSHRPKLVVNAAEPVLPDNFHRPNWL